MKSDNTPSSRLAIRHGSGIYHTVIGFPIGISSRIFRHCIVNHIVHTITKFPHSWFQLYRKVHARTHNSCHICFDKATALCDILYKRLRNILTYLLNYIHYFLFKDILLWKIQEIPLKSAKSSVIRTREWTDKSITSLVTTLMSVAVFDTGYVWCSCEGRDSRRPWWRMRDADGLQWRRGYSSWSASWKLPPRRRGHLPRRPTTDASCRVNAP